MHNGERMRAWSLLAVLGALGCGANEAEPTLDAAPSPPPAVHVVLFTHIEDNTPGGLLGSEQSRSSYVALRASLIEMAERMAAHDLPWVLQPDWKLLEAARLYETDADNVLRHLRDELGVTIDPHSHEQGGYNYTDVAHLLELLGVGGSTVIGGHIWDPSLAQFAEWDRFREPVAGLIYPEASWRGDVLIGAGTPDHLDDPLISGVWRPLDRDHFFDDDPDGNIVAVGSWHDAVAGVEELVALYADGVVPADVMLTTSWNLRPSSITAPGGIDDLEATILAPIAALRDQGLVVVSDFETLVSTWEAAGARAAVYQP